MIKSMTAFTHKEAANEQLTLTCEIRTVNHRYLEINLRLPNELRSTENKLRDIIKSRLKRGKVDICMRMEVKKTAQNDIQVNEPLARALILACQQVENLTENTTPLKAVDILNWPGVTNEAKPDLSEHFEHVQNLLIISLNDLTETRQREGRRLADFIYQRCDQIAEIIVRVRKRREAVIAAMREKVLSKLEELDISPDNNRLEQELVLQAQRLDVDEELDRIMVHLDEINDVLDRNEPVGRRLDFLMQELNREANTLASKSNDSETTQSAIDLKVLIEQIREQVQNIE